MDRRTKIILLIIASILLLAGVVWLVVWPLMQPTIEKAWPQPPAIQKSNPQDVPINGQGAQPGTSPDGTGTGSGQGNDLILNQGGANPDLLRIAELSRRAGVLAERIESGSSSYQFQNLSDATLDASETLAKKLGVMRTDLRAKHPATGTKYLTMARRLVEIPESESRITGNAFKVRVQMQVTVQDNGMQSTEYREATVTFILSGTEWLADDYSVQPFTP